VVIDASTFEKFQDACTTAQRTGFNLAEVLDGRGLLLTEKRKHDIEMRVLDDLVRRLSVQAPNKLLSWYQGRAEGTAAEMFAALQSWVETVVRNVEKGTLEDL
jgi:hypothetical protein